MQKNQLSALLTSLTVSDSQNDLETGFSLVTSLAD